MKKVSQVGVVIMIYLTVFQLLFSYSITSARLLPLMQIQGEELVNANGISHAGSAAQIQGDDLSNLMGLEECDEKDEDCIKRRMVKEAHLDYIYTQDHNKKP